MQAVGNAIHHFTRFFHVVFFAISNNLIFKIGEAYAKFDEAELKTLHGRVSRAVPEWAKHIVKSDDHVVVRIETKSGNQDCEGLDSIPNDVTVCKAHLYVLGQIGAGERVLRHVTRNYELRPHWRGHCELWGDSTVSGSYDDVKIPVYARNALVEGDFCDEALLEGHPTALKDRRVVWCEGAMVKCGAGAALFSEQMKLIKEGRDDWDWRVYKDGKVLPDDSVEAFRECRFPAEFEIWGASLEGAEGFSTHRVTFKIDGELLRVSDKRETSVLVARHDDFYILEEAPEGMPEGFFKEKRWLLRREADALSACERYRSLHGKELSFALYTMDLLGLALKSVVANGERYVLSLADSDREVSKECATYTVGNFQRCLSDLYPHTMGTPQRKERLSSTRYDFTVRVTVIPKNRAHARLVVFKVQMSRGIEGGRAQLSIKVLETNRAYLQRELSDVLKDEGERK